MASFGHSLPPAVKSCFATNPQILALVHKYPIQNGNSELVFAAMINYLSNHFV